MFGVDGLFGVGLGFGLGFALVVGAGVGVAGVAGDRVGRFIGGIGL